jgi:hypothetical protein
VTAAKRRRRLDESPVPTIATASVDACFKR